MTLTDTQNRLANKVLLRITECWQTVAGMADIEPSMSEQEIRIGLAALPFTKCPSRTQLQTRFEGGVAFYRIGSK